MTGHKKAVSESCGLKDEWDAGDEMMLRPQVGHPGMAAHIKGAGGITTHHHCHPHQKSHTPPVCFQPGILASAVYAPYCPGSHCSLGCLWMTRLQWLHMVVTALHHWWHLSLPAVSAPLRSAAKSQSVSKQAAFSTHYALVVFLFVCLFN